jgi:type II secretory pathway pseudopilin PulG
MKTSVKKLIMGAKNIKARIRARLQALKAQHREAGTTFVEVLVTIAIIAILMTTIAIAIIPQIQKAMIAATKTNIAALATATTSYYLDHNEYPDPSSWATDIKKYIADGKVPNDAWGTAFVYHKNPTEDIPFEIISGGPSKDTGGKDAIVSWKLDEKNEKDDQKNP